MTEGSSKVKCRCSLEKRVVIICSWDLGLGTLRWMIVVCGCGALRVLSSLPLLEDFHHHDHECDHNTQDLNCKASRAGIYHDLGMIIIVLFRTMLKLFLSAIYNNILFHFSFGY